MEEKNAALPDQGLFVSSHRVLYGFCVGVVVVAVVVFVDLGVGCWCW